MAARYREVKVVLRSSNGERAWMADVDTSAPVEQLLPDLIEALDIGGEADEYELRSEGSLEEPLLVLTAKGRSHVRGAREIAP